MTSEYQANMAFEDEVRRVAEAIWQLEPGHCQPRHYSDDPVVREIDGMARLRDVTHLMMVTVSTKLEKVKADVRKLQAAARLEAKRGLPTRLWLITRDQLDAQHISYAQENSVTVLTLDHFRNRFFNGRDYLSKRRKGVFGSARNLDNGTISINEDEYVELPMTLTVCGGSPSDGSSSQPLNVSIDDLVERLGRGEITVMTAPFGAGKSLTTREIFLSLLRRQNRNTGSKVPVAINLREHWGQDYGDEILERHARSIGFTPREDVTIAWRAGIIVLLIDGFDEVASQVAGRSDDLNFLRQTRFKALQGARDLISKTPAGVGILICGRDHYFDNHQELIHALGIGGRPFNQVKLSEFTEDQARAFLVKNNQSVSLPDWLPRKPLILGYLAHRELLGQILSIDASKGFGYVWREFLQLICLREAEHERATMDADVIQRVLERLACDVRATISGTGPITGRELAEAYHRETGQFPGEGVLMQLQRLPGLTEREQDQGARSFIDEDMLAALQGSAIARFLTGEIRDLGSRNWLSPLSSKGIAMASYLLHRAKADSAMVVAVGVRSSYNDNPAQTDRQIAADSLMIALAMAEESGRLDCHGTTLTNMMFGTIDIEELLVENLVLRGCIIEHVVVGSRGAESRSLHFEGCLIQKVSGSTSQKGLPAGMFIDCEIAEFDDRSTNNAILRSNLPPKIKALLTVLRKIYVQAGSGRSLQALRRGLPNGGVLEAIDEVLRVLESEKLIIVTGKTAHPIRKQQTRVLNILDAPMISTDPIIEQLR